MQINAVYEAMCLFLLIGMFIRPYKGIIHNFAAYSLLYRPQ